ncbi:MAG: class I SAM-dependent methyltransferase [Beijerinckiaceae bacterium]|nr:MAG: class I SAM-dependent methyltransferase [Beijerinckiaceae bacterium]
MFINISRDKEKPMDADVLAALSRPERLELWAEIINRTQAVAVLELGVWKGEFAEYLLTHCPSINRYNMLDPWRHLDRWKKPANTSQKHFDKILDEALRRTDLAKDKRVILRGTTVEVIEGISDASLDLVYIDGDHTLKGISIDLVRAYPKVRPGGIIGGDDYSPTIWQHAAKFEPTMVCPFAAYFAEAMGAPLIIFPQNQFAIIKPESGTYGADFRIIDTTGRYGEPAVLAQVRRPLWAHPLFKYLPSVSRPPFKN